MTTPCAPFQSIRKISVTTMLTCTGILQWRHMGIMASQIIGNPSICSMVCSVEHQRNTEVPHYWPFVRGMHRSLVVSPHKGPVTQKESPCYDVTMMKSVQSNNTPGNRHCEWSLQWRHNRRDGVSNSLAQNQIWYLVAKFWLPTLVYFL